MDDEAGTKARREAGTEHWFEIGSRLAWHRAQANNKKTWAATLKDAARSSGYSVGMLRRYTGAATFLKTFPVKSRPAAAIVGRSFAAIEVIERIHGLDPQLGSGLLTGLETGSSSVSDLRKVLSELKQGRVPRPDQNAGVLLAASAKRGSLPSPPSAYGPTRNDRERETMSRLRDLLPVLSGKVFAFAKPEGSAPPGLRCDAIAWTDRAFETGDGFEFAYAGPGSNRASLSDLVSRVTVASTLFRRYYVAFSQDSLPEQVEAVVESLALLDARSVGVVFLARPKPVLRKAKGKPAPDRRKLLARLCPKGQWIAHRHSWT
jgi:hypothetical protein